MQVLRAGTAQPGSLPAGAGATWDAAALFIPQQSCCAGSVGAALPFSCKSPGRSPLWLLPNASVSGRKTQGASGAG